jgi:ABC-2 type transport system permease protein
MNLKRSLAVVRKELLHVVRNRSTFFLTVLSPAFLLIVMMYAFTVDIKEVPVIILDNDRSTLSQRYVSGLLATGDVTLHGWARDYAELEQRLERGEVKAALVIPAGFMDDIVAGREAGVQVLIDGTSPSTANYATAHVVGFTQSLAAEILSEDLERMGYGELQFQPIDLRVRTWYNPTLRPLVGYAPALLAMVMGMPGILATMTIAREREHGTLEQLITTPIGRSELIVGKLVPYLLSGLLSALICVGLVVFWFQVPFRGSLLVFMLLSAFFLLATLGMGLLMSVYIKTQQAAQLVAMLVFFFPGFFLSGIFIPLSSMEPLMKMEAYAIPTTHYVVIGRQVFLKAWGLDQLWPYALALLLVGLAMTGLAVGLFRKKMS